MTDRVEAARRGPKSDKEYERVLGKPMRASELAAIWRMLPEDRRLSFVLALEETIAAQVILVTVQQARRKESDHI